VQLALVIIQTVAQVLSIIVIIHSLLSFVLPYDHPIQMALGKVVDPLLLPIRRVLPPLGGVDFSPMALILVIYLVEQLLTRLVVAVF
jgi:YggT family protein